MAKKPVEIEDLDSVEDADVDTDQEAPVNEDLKTLVGLRDQISDAAEQYQTALQTLVAALSELDLETEDDYEIEDVLDKHLPTLHAINARKEAIKEEIVLTVENLDDLD